MDILEIIIFDTVLLYFLIIRFYTLIIILYHMDLHLIEIYFHLLFLYKFPLYYYHHILFHLFAKYSQFLINKFLVLDKVSLDQLSSIHLCINLLCGAIR